MSKAEPVTFECPRCQWSNGVSTPEAAAILGTSRQTVGYRVQQGALDADEVPSGGRPGIRLVIPRAQVEALAAGKPKPRSRSIAKCPACGWPRANSMTLLEAAAELGVSKQTVINRVKDGTIEGYPMASGGGDNARLIVSRKAVEEHARRRDGDAA